MNEILSDVELKEIFFRTFGYQGTMNFTIYPTAWLRDLTLLDFGEDVYMGDGILLGTNQVNQDQEFIYTCTTSDTRTTGCGSVAQATWFEVDIPAGTDAFIEVEQLSGTRDLTVAAYSGGSCFIQLVVPKGGFPTILYIFRIPQGVR